MATEFPKKHFYKIGEVCSLTDTQPYVLRFWESEFPQLAPNKSRTGQRIYRPRDVELILEIKKLLYEEGYTIAGARKKLGMDSETSRPVPDASEGEPTPEALALLDTQEEVRAPSARFWPSWTVPTEGFPAPTARDNPSLQSECPPRRRPPLKVSTGPTRGPLSTPRMRPPRARHAEANHPFEGDAP